jgi:hypothetical protein
MGIGCGNGRDSFFLRGGKGYYGALNSVFCITDNDFGLTNRDVCVCVCVGICSSKVYERGT